MEKATLTKDEQLQTKHIETVKSPAHAPYNFIPLNEIVVEAEPMPDFNTYQHEGTRRHTGWMDLELETKTPLYIRDTLNEEEMDTKKEAEKEQKPFENSDFFSPNGEPQIPGSSLRGMIRTLVEITSYAKFKYFDDKNLYFRSFADVTSSLRNDYVQKMVQRVEGAYAIKPLAGYLKYSGSQLAIAPAVEKDHTTFYKVEERLVQEKLGESVYPESMSRRVEARGKIRIQPNRNYKFGFHEVFFKKQAPDQHEHGKYRRRSVWLYYGKVTDIMSAENGNRAPQGWEKGTLVWTGWMYGKHMHWVINEQDSDKNQIINLDERETHYQQLLKSYKDDANRDEQANLLKTLRERGNGSGVPCFYITDKQGRVTTFGHTGMFRLAYDLSIQDHIPKHLVNTTYKITPERLDRLEKDEVFTEFREALLPKLNELQQTEEFEEEAFEKQLQGLLERIPEKHRNHCEKTLKRHLQVIDIPEAIFGNESLFAGRVFFEDARLCDEQSDVLMDEVVPKILASPKPTTFQHYLVQTTENNRELNHYNTHDAAIRGYKQYWHKSGKVWEDPQKDWIQKNYGEIYKHQTQYTKIKPIEPRTQFTGRIRFENLSDVELGALLFNLKLPEGCYHKLGMGKPLGLGSVEIIPKLHLSQREQRYRDLFAEWSSATTTWEESGTYIKAFENYVKTQIGAEGSLWNTERLRELRLMLDYHIGSKLEEEGETRYMEITPQNEYRDRPVLPLPGGVNELRYISVSSEPLDDKQETQSVVVS
ncbi:MAG: TIGR03986 family CRISPR-associated RAMP protein [Candidatus Vecturithrix sp.]|jgi:hypothetical protein|nr:TIGR03986 family CRISPR-associated RAMP protein [Candidatus Vecturithrix sp.]